MTRIGDTAQADRVLGALQASSGRIRAAQIEAATGKRATTFAELGSEAGLLLRTRQQKALTTTYLQQNAQVADRLNVMDGALANLGDIAQKMRSLLTQRLDAASGRAVPLAAQADTMLDEVAAQLNIRLDDRYLFAGSKVDAEPVRLDKDAAVLGPDAYYKGDQVVQTTRADHDVVVAYGLTADDPAFAGLISALHDAKVADEANDAGGLRSALDRLGGVVSDLAGLRGRTGAVGERLQTIADGQETASTYLDDIVSRLEDADVAETVTRLARDQANLQAAYLTTSRLSQLSLTEYLR